jgi:opacity protein-like surface antigen
MLRFVRRLCTQGLAATLLLALPCFGARAEDGAGPEGRGTYLGIFGGAGASRIDHVNQSGTALFPDSRGGPLAVNAVGDSGYRAEGIVGGHIGYEWSGCWLGREGSCWGVLPAAELEGYYLGGSQRADLDNPTPRLPEHLFDVSFPMDKGVFMTNAVLSLQTPYSGLNPYIGGGVGAAGVSIHGADSLQLSPAEPGVNHFNSGTNSSTWGFAAQAKIGLRVSLSQHSYLFTEYRFLYVGATDYTFGSTQYPTHVPTTPWNVHFGDMFNHLGVVGIGFNF